VNEIIEAKKADAKADTKDLEAKIDELVYGLYELTADEIAIVEGKDAEARTE
jgi:adenine-specific DNA-methyltransferase